MNTGLAFIILGEVALTLFVVWGFMHENRFIAFEDRVISRIKENLNEKSNEKARRRNARINSKVRYTPEIPSTRKNGSVTEAA